MILPHPVANKKLDMTISVSGNENRHPPVWTRVLQTLPIRGSCACGRQPNTSHTANYSHTSYRAKIPSPIGNKEERPHTASHGKVLQARSAAESSVAPVEIKALTRDLGCFMKKWTDMLDELYASAGRHAGGLANPSSCIHPIIESENPGTPQVNDLGEQTCNILRMVS